MDSAYYTEIERLEFIINEALMDEWIAQGHEMTGEVYKAIEYEVKQTVDTLTLSGFVPFYGNIIAAGTKAGRIPYSGRTGRGGTSLYIQALQRYAEVRMNIEAGRKSLSVAFAIANTQKKTGMPTPGSYKYTSTGKRTDWVEDAFRKNEDKITEAVREMSYNVLSVNLDVILARWQIEINRENAA